MPEQHRALEWLARRRDGESVAYIASRAGVEDEVVRRATKDYGPFPRATRHLGRVHAIERVLPDRTRRWIEARQRGHTVAEIARAEGVSHQLVSRVTVEHGPFPAPAIVDDWVQARGRGLGVAAIAEEAHVPPGAVRRATDGYGPYPARGPKLPEGVLGRSAGGPGVECKPDRGCPMAADGVFDPPDFVTTRGRYLWLQATISAWVNQTDQLVECPGAGLWRDTAGRHTL